MDYSDDENVKIEQEVDAFRSIIPLRPRNNPGGHGKLQLCKQALQTKSQCLKLMESILSFRIQDTVQKVFATIIENWSHKNSIVIVLNLKRNQKNDLSKFIDTIAKFKFKLGQQLKTISVEQIAKDDVRDIALEIQIREDQLRQNLIDADNPVFISKDGSKVQLKSHLVVYVNRRVTNLSQQNIHVFQNTVIQANYAVIIPTFESLKIIDGQGILQENQKFYFEAYNSKELFIQFFYRSLVSKHTMAYLPKQILGLIKMYDFYPISYQQGCNMLIYACQLFDAKCQEKGKPTKKLVQMKDLIRVFNSSWKFIWRDQEETRQYHFDKLSHVILDQDAGYRVCEKKILNYLRMSNVKDTGIDDLTEKKVYQKFEEKFKAKLLAEQSLKHLAKVLEDFDSAKVKEQNVKMRKRTGANRQLGLGFTQKSFKSQKEYFQDKITRLFKYATAEVRRQAQYVDWEELNIFQMMCPQILKDTVDGLMQDPDFRDVFNTIRSYASFPMARLIEKFQKMQIGRLIYILRCLELKGLIELNKSTLRPSLITNFYDKANFRMSGE